MILNVWDSIRNFFINLFNDFSWGSLFVLFAGIIIGLMIAGVIYIVTFLVSIKKSSKQIEKEKEESKDAIIKASDINDVINGYKDSFKEEARDFSVSQKLEWLKISIVPLINDIAKIYYPDSKYPAAELTVDESLELARYIINKVDIILDGRILRMVRKSKISEVLKLIDTTKKVKDSKIVQTAKKVGGIGQTVLNALNAINPVHLIKKAATAGVLNFGINKIVNILIDIIGEETSRIYSKKLFDKDIEIESDIEKDLEEKEEE